MANYVSSNFGVDKKFLTALWDKAKLFGIDLAVISHKHQIANPLDFLGERIPLTLVSPLYMMPLNKSYRCPSIFT